ncbi:hypothetical protein H2202_001137 [Exophiala xenobiotica]|nr:hypothetical protein H2202_001137 [Exophiala xenobiotica]KAK5221033.1 hypothetical protein LTR72_006591 [Exophiala xenobiotica]KAK5234161.1 hypothetical protein LTR47_004752 [Exophiala xenobiotica]KAK5245021.1 hypothetical protein LTS06_009473 [Exophiala xenobiotica]KAK5282020.1 hypothetical protein LTR40_003925 [Exophiala xenobiotica]
MEGYPNINVPMSGQRQPVITPWPQPEMQAHDDSNMIGALPDLSSQGNQTGPATRATRAATKHTSRACTSCRRRRRKCDGDQGGGKCSECIKHGFECILDADTDMRRKMHREKARKDQRLLHQVLTTLRQRSDSRAQTLLNLISEDAPVAAIEAHLAQSGAETLAPEDEALESSSDAQANPAQSSTSRLISLTALLNPQSPQGRISQITELVRPRIRLPEADHLAFIRKPAGGYVPDRSNSSQQHPRPLSDQDNYVEPGAVKSFGNLPMSSAIRANGWGADVQQQQLSMLQKPMYACSPLLLDEGSIADPLSEAALGFIENARSLMAQGQPVRTILSMDGLHTELFFRDRSPEDMQTVSTWACEFTKSWKGMLPQTCLYTTLHMVACFMRWMILPCRDTWLLMPEIMRPMVDQMVVPHHKLFVDLCHIPQLRKSFLQYNRDFSHILRYDTFNPNWAFGDEACVEGIEGAGLGEKSRLTPAFTTHIDNIDNWSLHKSVLAHFPELSNQIRFHDDF